MAFRKILIVLFIGCLSNYVKSHSYHFGQCPILEPMQEFSIEKFLGKWYAIQKTSTSSRCLQYTFSKTDEPNQYQVDQMSENAIINIAKSNNYHYIGTLKVDPSLPSRMIVKYPLSVVGKASFIIFATDYSNYAAVYSCQKIPFGNRHSVTILSRSKTLDKQYLEKIRNRIALSNVNPFDLTIIDQNNCANLNSTMRIEINSQTFSAHNIGQAVGKVGSSIGNGVEYIIEGGKKIYQGARSSDSKASTSPDSEFEWVP